MLPPDFPRLFSLKRACGSEDGSCQNMSSWGGGGWLGEEVGGHGFAVVGARSPWRGWVSGLPSDSEASLSEGLGASRDSRQPL